MKKIGLIVIGLFVIMNLSLVFFNQNGAWWTIALYGFAAGFCSGFFIVLWKPLT